MDLSPGFDENLEAILVLDACNDQGSTQDEIKDALGLTEEQFEGLMDLVDLQDYKGPDVCQEILDQSYATCDDPEMQTACCPTCTGL